MNITLYQDGNPPPCPFPDGQGEWIFVTVPIKVNTSTTFTPNASSMNLPYSSYPQTAHHDMAPGPAFSYPQMAWDQQQLLTPAGIFDHMQPVVGSHMSSWGSDNSTSILPTASSEASFPGDIDFDINLALELEACLNNNTQSGWSAEPFSYFDAEGSSSPVSACSPYPTMSYSPITPPMTTNGTPCSTPSSPELHLCCVPDCFATFTKTADLKKHERKHKQSFRCPICNKGHVDKRALDRHLWSRHEDYARSTGVKSERIRCRACDYESRADNVRRHEKSQHPAACGS